MLNSAPCPICDDENWTVIGQQTFRRDQPTLKPFVARRLQVLFEVWLPNQTEVKIRYSLCENCGFVCQFPRPTPDDITNKYGLLTKLQQEKKRPPRTANANSTARDVGRPSISAVQQKRSTQLYDDLKAQLGARREILDLGGGSGVLLSHFIETGKKCFVVDYYKRPIAGVEYLGKTLNDIPEDKKFDVIVSSHVLEHVVDPAAIIQEVKQRLRPNGLFYLEVPSELKGGSPVREDPVTHINFFSPSSAKSLMILSGFKVLKADSVASIFETGATRPAVRILATPTASPPRNYRPSSKETKALLKKASANRTLRMIASSLPHQVRSRLQKLRRAL